MLFTVSLVTMDFGMKGPGNLTRRAAEVNEGAPCCHPVHGESALRKPAGDFLYVPGRRTKKRSVLFGREPLVEVGRMRIVLLFHELVERLLLGCSTFEHHQDVLLRKIVGHATQVCRCPCGGAGITW